MDYGISSQNIISKRKPVFPINQNFREYLKEFERWLPIGIHYEDLLRFTDSTPVLDAQGKDSLWLSVIYQQSEFDEIKENLKHIYMLLSSDGSKELSEHLQIEQIDFCTFGNSKPFRIKIKNQLNDNHDYFYVKSADVSRIYGLELEQILSPNQINYVVWGNTLIEEHISGIPGDTFLNEFEPEKHNLIRLSKEFVKFNERCMVRLLGDMRSYNYVFVLTPDFDDVQYRIRPIDFDQQCYEGKFNMYRPQFFKENKKLVDIVLNYLTDESIKQYQNEERSLTAKRIIASKHRLIFLLDILREDTISTPAKILELKTALKKYTGDVKFKKCNTMGDVLHAALSFILRNYENSIESL